MYGLLFDVDGVLGDTEGPVAEATIKMFQDLYGAVLTPEDFVPYVGTGAERYVEGPAEDNNITIDLQKAVAVRHENFVAILESGRDISFPGAGALVDLVYTHPEWKLSIATSSPGEKSRATLKAARIDAEKFDAYINGDMITHKKPHPEIYLTAAEAIGLPPSACVVVEDAITGVASGKAAGMKVIAFTSFFSKEELSQADIIVDSLEEVTLAMLEGLVKG